MLLRRLLSDRGTDVVADCSKMTGEPHISDAHVATNMLEAALR